MTSSEEEETSTGKITLVRNDEGKIQPCVKVESDTVHYNLLKVLNALKDIINE